MGVKISNNATSTLAADITNSATSLSVQSADASKFPSPGAGEWFPATLVDASGNMEIVKVTARTSAALTIVRAQEGTAARAWVTGDRIDLRATAAAWASKLDADAIDVDSTFAANSDSKVPSQKAVLSAFNALKNGVSSSFDTLAEIAAAFPMAAQISGAGTDADPTDDDVFGFRDTTTGNLFKRSWGNLKAALAASAANFLANANSLFLTVSALWSAATEVTLTDAATIAVDMSTFINAKVTLGGNRTLGQPSSTKVGQTGRIRIIQDGTGSRTLAYHADWKWAGGTAPTLSTAANKVDVLYYEVLAANTILGSLQKDVR